MKKINYTKEMEEQDFLWAKEKESLDIMEKLFKEIEKQSYDLGFDGIFHIYDGIDEKIVEVYKNKKQLELAQLGIINDVPCFGYCKPLIKYIEKILN